MNLSRRGLLFGRSRVIKAGLRPPGALAEAAFLDACTACDDCSKACPSQIIVHGDGRFPEMDFTHGECTFCGDCQSACKTGALTGAKPDWKVQIANDKCIASQGVECRVCGEACAARALVFRPRLGGVALPEIDTDRCNGCGACIAPCPMQALSIKETP